MNPLADLIARFQELVAQVPEIIQPFIIMFAAAIPFIEGEVGALIGVVGGVNPFVAAAAALIGNVASVVGVVAVSSRAREFAVARRHDRAPSGAASTVLTEERPEPQKPQSKGRERFARWVVRFGVPGASILGPLAIPTQFMSAMLVAGGTPKGWVLLWQGVSIFFWTTLSTVLAWLALATFGV